MQAKGVILFYEGNVAIYYLGRYVYVGSSQKHRRPQGGAQGVLASPPSPSYGPP